MSLRRILLLSSKHRAGDASCLLHRVGRNGRVQSCNYSSSSRCGHKEPITNRITAVKDESSPSWHNYVIPTLFVGGLAGFAMLLHYNDEKRAVLKGQDSSCQANAQLGPMIGGPFTLIDTEEQIVTGKNFLGNWVLLHFGYTSSPDVGPEQLKIMAKAIDVLESKQKVKILPVFVTIDPQRDTPSHLRAYLREFDSRIVGLTGPVAAVRQMAQEYRVYFRKVEEEGDDYLVESSHNMYLLNPNMEVVRCFGIEYGADELSEAIVKELKRNPSP
ncbi:protein SCO1 homolog 2, mitochondrial [Punica granatum]|uniref:Protein SCO1 homolog 2, mitochondrial n=2 Tax=Punica granatum TaxID=22663 RepID=A0A6P8CZ17_PUNGR|nr:protein SCO1 homolog 2, mitochondrial [Punica granatum]XP_031387379.1 protein SCO1 homolog 2, mitochondrial [Punica granatum]